jgi:integrase
MLTSLQTEETSMHNEPSQKPGDPRQTPWNKGKLIGSKPPLRTKDVWSIRTKLQVEKRTRDLAVFNLAIDSKLRGCDVVSLRVEDVAPHGVTVDRVTVRQRKTGHPVRFEISEQTREAVDELHPVGPKKALVNFSFLADATRTAA